LLWLLAVGPAERGLLARIDLSSLFIFYCILTSILLLKLLLFLLWLLAVGPAERGLLAHIDLSSTFIFYYILSSIRLLKTHTSSITLADTLAKG
jgi:hypothetical protein